MNFRLLYLGLAGALLLSLNLAESIRAEESRRLVVVASSRWDVDGIGMRDLKQVYLGRPVTLAGARVKPIDGAGNSSAFSRFRQRVVRMSRRSFEDYWLEQALSGGARPPRQIDDERDRLQYVARTVGAIAYVDASELPRNSSGLRVLKVDGQGPSDPRYPLVD